VGGTALDPRVRLYSEPEAQAGADSSVDLIWTWRWQ